MSTLREHGAPSPLCARGQLERAIEQMRETHGLTGIAAGEPEFYLFERDDAGRATRTPTASTASRTRSTASPIRRACSAGSTASSSTSTSTSPS
ncbi:hypothetical protein [Leucobacter soli]|uniref:hypothetical protein n=1 Tax=Leucobacter soli TaxID=2812850 RepID=UPI003617A6CA